LGYFNLRSYLKFHFLMENMIYFILISSFLSLKSASKKTLN